MIVNIFERGSRRVLQVRARTVRRSLRRRCAFHEMLGRFELEPAALTSRWYALTLTTMFLVKMLTGRYAVMWIRF
jgi:hypothetical protein